MYIKNLKKKYQEKWENAYLRAKNPRASRALRRALDPSHYWLTFAHSDSASLCRQNLRKHFWGPPLTKSWNLLDLDLYIAKI